jgi:hypothetical protein
VLTTLARARAHKLHKKAATALAAAVVAAGVGAVAWYGATSREGRSELNSTSGIAANLRKETGAGGAAAAHSCDHPVFKTAARYGIWSRGAYNVFNNMWNEQNPQPTGPGSQQLYVCNYNSWYVVADMPGPGQPPGSVKTYPNVQENFPSVRLTKFAQLSSTFTEADAHVGDYEDAYDTWLNGVASTGSNEVMIWNEDHGQTPAGSPEATATFGGTTYTVWRTSDASYIAFVARPYFTSGTVNLLDFYQWLMKKGWLRKTSVLNQVDYGVEICSTGGAPEKFSFTNFSINARY